MAQEKQEKTFFKWISDPEKWRKWVVIFGLAGIVLIFFSGFFGKTQKEEKIENSESASVTTYAQQLEEKLCGMVDVITGQSGAQVILTMERGTEQVYATEQKKSTESAGEKQSDDTETTYILVKKADGSQTALAVTELEPVVKGVVVVCPRGDETEIRQSIIDALTTVLHISSARVCVLCAN